jgi:hypothetical protein
MTFQLLLSFAGIAAEEDLSFMLYFLIITHFFRIDNQSFPVPIFFEE